MIKRWQKWFSQRRRSPKDWFACPLCGEPVRVGSMACRACGSDRQTGWASEAQSESVDLGPAGEEFDYEGWLRRELDGVDPRSKRLGWRPWMAWAVVILLAAALLIGAGTHTGKG